MYKAKEKKKICPLLNIFNLRELEGGIDYRHETSNHGLALLFLKLNTCLQSYIHLHHPEEVEGAQADS